MHLSSGSSKRPPVLIMTALLALYFIWGSTYLAMRVAIDSFPPFMMAGLRNLIAGVMVYVFLRMRGVPSPGPVQWRGAALVGCLLLAAGNGSVAYAQQWVATGLAALIVATVPLLTIIFTGLWGHWPRRLEWVGIGLGLLGIVLLNMGENMRASPLGAAILLFAAASWSLGSVWSGRLSLPQGLMGAATQMLAGGLLLLALSLLMGERLSATPSFLSLLSMGYLIVFGSIIAFSCYLFLLKTVRPALATSYAYVNPIIAVWLGMVFLNEKISPLEFIAMPLILSAVILVMLRLPHD